MKMSAEKKFIGGYELFFSTIGGRAAPQTLLLPWGGRRPPQTALAPRAGGLGGPSASLGKQGGLGGGTPPNCGEKKFIAPYELFFSSHFHGLEKFIVP